MKNLPNVWAFAKADEYTRPLLVESVKNGKSRFGWSSADDQNIFSETWTEYHSKHQFLKNIQPDDWIVHINTPDYNRCMAAKVTSTYQYDEGFGPKEYGYDRRDFRHCFEVDPDSVITFFRRDENVLPSVNLCPRQRYHRIREREGFFESIENLKDTKVKLKNGQSREEYHLKADTDTILHQITEKIQRSHKSKAFEKFLLKVFEKIDEVEVYSNGFGWGTDHGADLIVTTTDPLGFQRTIVVQAKSYEGVHNNEGVLDDIKRAFAHFKEADAAMIFTTGNPTEELGDKIAEYSDKCGKEIQLIGGADVAGFAIKHAPDEVFNL